MTRWSRQLVIALSFLLCLPGVAFSAIGNPAMNSTTYSVIESELGASGCDPVISGSFCGSSTNYSTSPGVDDGGSTLGEAAVGNSSSTNYQTNAGYDTTQYPGLMMVINTGGVPLTPNPMISTAASFGSANFDIRDYTSYGYIVQVYGTAPSNGSHTLTSMSTDATSSPGTEQFGINTRLNPTSGYGADPQDFSGIGFSHGVSGNGGGGYGLTSPYTIPNEFRFNPAETIASSPSSSGDTRFTITFVANIHTSSAPVTPAGNYKANLTLVTTGTY